MDMYLVFGLVIEISDVIYIVRGYGKVYYL